MVAHAVPQRGQIVFAHAEIIVNLRRRVVGAGRERAAFDLFKNGFGFFWRRRRRLVGGERDRRALRQGGGTVFRRGVARQLRIELLDFGFQRGDLVVQRAGLVGNQIWLFLCHANLLSRENGDENAQCAERDQQQRPGEGKTDFAELAKAQVRERSGGGGRIFFQRRGGVFSFTGEGGNFQPGGIPFHPCILDGGQRAGEFDLKVFLCPRLVVDGLHFGERGAKIVQRLDHLLGVAAGGELGFFEQAEATRELLDDFLAAGGELILAAAQFFQAGAFALKFFLCALEFDKFLLRLHNLAVHVVARGRGKRRFLRRQISVNKFS